MPELPEVETIAADLNEMVRGLTIAEALVNREKIIAGQAKIFALRLAGAKIEEVCRLGKWLHFRLGGPFGPVHLLAHLKMTGQFLLEPWADSRVWPKHVHAALCLAPSPGLALFYRDIRQFGRLRALNQAEWAVFLEKLNLGPDPLMVTAEEFHQRLTARRGRLKPTLLNQAVVAGFGNIYADESLFAARLSPFISAALLSRAETGRLLREAKRIFTAAIAARGSTTNNYQGLKGGGAYQARHLVYGRAGRPCPVCGTAIQRLALGGRGTHICPSCQIGRAHV